MDRQPDTAGSDGSDPPVDDAGIEAELADDVGGKGLLVEHHLDRGLVADERVALRVAGDAHVSYAVLELGHLREQCRCAGEPSRRHVHIAGDHEEVADADSDEATEDLLQVLLVPDEASCEVRRNLEPG